MSSSSCGKSVLLYLLLFVRRLGKPIEMCTGLVRMREKVRQCSQQLQLEQEMMDDVCIVTLGMFIFI